MTYLLIALGWLILVGLIIAFFIGAHRHDGDLPPWNPKGGP